MHAPLIVWAKVLLRLGLVLLAVGILPALLVQYVFTGFDALIPALLLFSAAPLGVLISAISVTLFLVALARRPPKAPS